MGVLSNMNPDPAKTSTPPTPPTPPPEETEPLAVSTSREEERRGERREVQLPAKQTCDRCWQTPETWEESPCDYNDRVRVTCRVCGKFIGYRLHEWAKKQEKREKREKRRKRR